MPMMHRTGRWVILLLLIAGLISTPCLAFSGEEEINHLYASLPDDRTDALRAAQDENGLDLNRGLHQLVENAYQAVGGILKEGLKTSASLLAVCLLCSLSSLLIGEQNVIGNNAVRCASVGTVLLIGVQRVQSSLSLVSELLEELRVFANALLPAMTAAGVAAGSGSSAFAKQSAAVLGADLMIGLFAMPFAADLCDARNSDCRHTLSERLFESIQCIYPQHNRTRHPHVVGFISGLSVRLWSGWFCCRYACQKSGQNRCICRHPDRRRHAD